MFNLFGWNFNTFYNPFMNWFMPVQRFNPFMGYSYYMPAQTNSALSIFQNYYSTYSPVRYTPEPYSIFAAQTALTRTSTAYKTNNNDKVQYFHGVKYNQTKGEALAKKIVDILPSDRDPENPLCAKYVKKAIEACGLGRYELGNADACTNIFRRNPNFKEVKIKGEELSTVPKGTVIVYDAFDTVKFKNGETDEIGENGHTLIALGNGKGCSDIIEDEIYQSDRAHVFIPV